MDQARFDALIQQVSQIPANYERDRLAALMKAANQLADGLSAEGEDAITAQLHLANATLMSTAQMLQLAGMARLSQQMVAISEGIYPAPED